MSQNSQMTRSRILDCARKEFMEHGYQNANMRRIASVADVTTGAMYNHFANKSVLFDALVEAPAEEMLLRFQEIHKEVQSVLKYEHMELTANSGTDWMIGYIYANFDVFKLIFCCSEGTKWAKYLEKLIEIEEQAYHIYCNKMGKNGNNIEPIFLHIHATSGFQYLVELVSHDIPYEQAVAVMNNAKRFSMAGWQELLGL